MAVSNLNTFIGYEIFHKKIDIISHKLAFISVLAIPLKKKTKVFWCVKEVYHPKTRRCFFPLDLCGNSY